ncbi:MAG: diguanylate cyclase [Bacillota bacterium]|nr:diguanylate cyclase [Bacillota bacterium]
MKMINTYYEDKPGLKKFIEEHSDILFFQKSTVFVQVFSGVYEEDFLKELSLEITEMVPHALIIGATTAGEIMNGKVSDLKTVISFSIFQHTEIRSTFILKNGRSDYELGQVVASRLTSEKAKAIILFSTTFSINAVDLLAGVQSINPALPVVGGNAGNDAHSGTTLVFDTNNVTDCGVVAAVLESDQLYVSRHWDLGWQPIGREMTVTKADKSRVYTIDNIPADRAYETYLGVKDITNYESARAYPLVMDRHGVTTARIAGYNYEDGSLDFFGDIKEGEKVRFSYGHVENISENIERLCKEVMMHPSEGIFIYSCSCRRSFLGDSIEIETAPLQKIAPSAGFYTFGEFFHVAGTNQLLNSTLTILVLSESERTGSSWLSETALDEASPDQRLVTKDIVADRNIGVLRSLTHLVDKVTDEFAAANEKLKYLSLHDALTGLYNRAHFEEKMKRLDTYEGAVGIIICDVDCLKLINDILGHNFGDRIIRMAAECLTASCRPRDIIARIGGDEFSILIPDADEPLLAEICNKIFSNASGKGYSGSSQVLHLSAGFALKGQNAAKDMIEAFKIADLNMYRRKQTETAKVQKIIVNTLTRIKSSAELDILEEVKVNAGSSNQTITQREWAQTQIRREMERTATLLKVSSKVNESTYEKVFDVLCEESAKALKVPATFLHLYDGRKESFLLAARYGCTEQACIIPSSLSDSFNCQDICIDDDTLMLSRIENGLLVPLDLKKIVRIKLVHEQQIIGVLSCCISDENFSLEDNDGALIDGLADLAVVHIVKAHLWHENRKQLDAITILFNNGQRLAHSLDMNDIAQDVCRTCVEAFGSSLSWLGKAEEDGSIKVIGFYPDADYLSKLNARWDVIPAVKEPFCDAMRLGLPVIINDLRKDSRFDMWLTTAVNFGVQSAAAVPLISRGKAFGALMLYGKSTDFFDQENLYYLQAFAHQAAAALQNAKLFHEAENRALLLEALHEIDTAITKNLDLNRTLSTVMDQVVSRLRVDAADILLYDEETQMLNYAVGRGFCSSTARQLPGRYKEGRTLEHRREIILQREGMPYYRAFHLLSKGKLQGVLEIFKREPFLKDQEWETFVDMLVNQTAIAIDEARLLNGLRDTNMELTAAYDATIEGWSRILDLRDKETEGHSQRVTRITLSLAQAMGMKESELLYIRWGALLHDIGKMGVPDNVLLKPGPLEDSEWEIMRKHPVYAYDMLFPIDYLRPALDIPYAHHEKWDGTGYPRGLKGEEIPLAARIFAIADVVDALASDRPYRKAWNFQRILEHIKSLSGSHFDPQVVELFCKNKIIYTERGLEIG